VDAPIAGNLWQVKVSPGQRVAQGAADDPGVDEDGNQHDRA
jgi:hypothetical protein